MTSVSSDAIAETIVSQTLSARARPTVGTRLALRIQDRFEQLSPAERKLAGLLLERADDLLTYSATELAGLAGVSKATAARLFQSLGYRDFNEVRLQAREERNRTAPVQRVAVPAGRGGRTSIAGHLRAETDLLIRTFEELRSDRLREMAARLAEAPRVWILGLGNEEGLARHARLLLARVRPDVQLLGGHVGAWAEDLAVAGAGEAALILASRPAPPLLLPIVEVLATTRLRLVGIADPTSVGALRRAGAVVVACHTGSSPLGGSATALLSVLRLLVLATAERIGEPARRRIELIGEIREELGEPPA
jgi:DNA-binding MurR/RpiR family transcriptional regulator